MEYSEEFKTIVKNCVDNNAHIGGGNPNAKILFVGKEAAYGEEQDEYKSNINEWNININNPDSQLRLEYPDNFSVGETWSKYQKLHNYTFPEFIPKEGMMNFQERIFTTEMSDNPAKKTKDAQSKIDFKTRLQDRKNTFFGEDFIQKFPVIVLACSNYIKNNHKLREIDKMFTVTYPVLDNGNPDDELGKHWYNKSNWFYLHFNEEKTKLVIHTRNLSADVLEIMLKDMGKIIRNHLEKNNLL